MTETEVIGNRLIGEFVSDDFFADLGFTYPRPMFKEGRILPENCKFHSSWDWLMPVVEKIEKDLEMYIRVDKDYASICKFCDYSGLVIKTNNFTHKKGKIFGVWGAVVEFIKWYNNDKR